MKVRKSGRKELILFSSAERPIKVNIFSCNFIRSLGIGKYAKIGVKSFEDAKNAIFQFYNSLGDL